MTARFNRAWTKASRANLASVSLLLKPTVSRSASTAPTGPEPRRAGTQEVFRLGAGKIPSFRAITRLLRRQKARLSAAAYEP